MNELLIILSLKYQHRNYYTYEIFVDNNLTMSVLIKNEDYKYLAGGWETYWDAHHIDYRRIDENDVILLVREDAL